MAAQKPSLTVGTSLEAHLALVRVPNCILIGLAVVVGEAIASGTMPPLDRAIPGFLTAFLLMAGTMVLNDIYDADVDRLNNPQRPIPSGKIRPRKALAFSIVLATSGIFFSVLTGLWTALTALLALVLMIYYNTGGKRTGLLGNAVVSFNVALPFLYGGLAVGSLRSLLFIFSILAFLANLGREVAKGIPDAQGDRPLGIMTVAVSYGPKKAAAVSALLFLTAVGLSFLPPLLGTVSLLYYPGVVLADLGFVYSAYRLLLNQKPESVRRVKNRVLVWMFLGLVGFLLGGIGVL